MAILNDDQKIRSVELFAQGMPRSDIAQLFIDEPTDEISDAIFESDEQTVKEKIANELRNCDPSSAKFAANKYGTLLAQHRDAVKTALANRYDEIIAGQIKEGQRISTDLDELIDDLKTTLENAQEPDPTGNSEYLNTMRTLTQLYKAKSEHSARVLTLLELFKE